MALPHDGSTPFRSTISLTTNMTITATRALVVLSGGQDSTTCLYWAIQKWGRLNVSAVTYDYYQRHAIEVKAAVAIAKMAGVAWHRVVRIGRILDGTSPLINRDTQLERYPDYDTMEKVLGDRVEKTFVPMRNALFLTLAANMAAVYDTDNIITGVCQADNANYPDCRRQFIDRTENMINEALGYNAHHGGERYIQIHTPLMDRTKAGTVRLALSLRGGWHALAYTHTAYDGSYPPTGTDHASMLRAHGFEEANLPDPLILRAYKEGLLTSLPATRNYSEKALAIAEEAALPYTA